MQDADADEKNYFAGIIQKGSEQLLMVIDDVMLLSRLQSEKLPVNNSEFSPAGLVTDVYQMFNLPDLKKGLELTANIPVQHKNLIVRSDADKIKQVLANLVSNAIKYTLKGGVELGFDMQNRNVEFYVKDTGMGISEREQKQIFEPFYRGEQVISAAIGGTGLGLNIAKELIELLGGEIGVNSAPNQGSRFYFTIPVEQSDKSHSEKALPQAFQEDWKDLTILIAEDEPDNYLYLEILLKNKVKRIDHAINGMKAVELSSKNRYNLVLMDLKMPVMDGIEATKKIKQQFPDIPIIAQTAYTTPEEKDKALQAGCDAYIAKPIKKADLMAIINKVLS
jgi:CheY-like chemotaxis protein